MFIHILIFLFLIYLLCAQSYSDILFSPPPPKGDSPREPSLVLILKWGGELTPAGRIQAEELGRIFRCMYPGGQGTVNIFVIFAI